MSERPPRNGPKLACPACTYEVSRVTPKTMRQPSLEFYRRTRECLKCGHQFETRERITKYATSSAENP